MRDLDAIEAAEWVHGEAILPPEPGELSDPYEPVCETCGDDRIVRVWGGRENQRHTCPDCVMRGLA